MLRHFVFFLILKIIFFLVPLRSASRRHLRHDSEHGVVTADARPDFLVILLGVAHLVKLRLENKKCSKSSTGVRHFLFPKENYKNTHGGREHRSSEPHGVPLHVVGDDLNVDGLRLQTKTSGSAKTPWLNVNMLWPHEPYLQLAAAQLLADLQPCVHGPLQVPLQAPAEVPEHGGTTGEHDVLKDRDAILKCFCVDSGEQWCLKGLHITFC